MALLLPTVPLRMLIAFWSIVGVAVVNSFAVAGWCARTRSLRAASAHPHAHAPTLQTHHQPTTPKR